MSTQLCKNSVALCDVASKIWISQEWLIIVLLAKFVRKNNDMILGYFYFSPTMFSIQQWKNVHLTLTDCHCNYAEACSH